LGITPENSAEYLLTDGVHLSGKGRLCYAKALISFMEANILVALQE
jgi:poly-D-alanine transfer protein DltD